MTEPRYDTFTFKVNRDERRMIEGLAARLERSQSDVLRLLVREAARELAAVPPKQPPAQHKNTAQPAAA